MGRGHKLLCRCCIFIKRPFSVTWSHIIHPYLKLCTRNLFQKVVGGIVIEEKIIERYLIFYTAWLFFIRSFALKRLSILVLFKLITRSSVVIE